ncbi:MAG: hypothetical protein IJ626_04025 [Muribaculaceae bacterium]|nr:hypothetical protein [Muribaculaceae bacterium]
MKNKKERLRAIIEIIKTNHIGNQFELCDKLAERGFSVTQATLSRDIKTLRITKVATDRGQYMYIVPDSNNLQNSLLMNHNQQIGFVSVDFSQNIAVIKTRNGYATGLAYDIDMSQSKEILGTIAGADTVFAIIREGVPRSAVLKLLSRFIPIDNQ